MVNVNEAFNSLMNERDKVVEELAEEKSRVQALLNELKNWRDKVNNQSSSSSLGSGKQEKRVTIFHNFSVLLLFSNLSFDLISLE